ncbi:acetyltransferase [Rhizopogon vesiculosus]|uniref:Acetyltransferase n=1 Tax=Rhizopogon vesiculosus TaxID=180088 RepID=A0A1J8QHY8_9AGAM|nr:acetyltransferase [Rhizopogon vesiculosus]
MTGTGTEQSVWCKPPCYMDPPQWPSLLVSVLLSTPGPPFNPVNAALMRISLDGFAGFWRIISPPYIVFAGFSIGAGIFINQHQDVANPSNGLFCTIHVEYLALPVPVFCAAVMILVVCFEGDITLTKNCNDTQTNLRRIHSQSLSPSDTIRDGNSWSVLPVFVDSSGPTSAVILFLTKQPPDVAPLVLAALPLASALVFGLQKDMLHAWFPGVFNRMQPATGTPEIPNARPTRSNSLSQVTSVA